MSSEAAFLRAIRDDPDDDTPRLVFADWLEEHGDPVRAARGELMRVQCELARWVPDLRRRTQLLEREQRLLAAYRDDWLGPLRPLVRRHRFERGLLNITLASGWPSDREPLTSIRGSMLRDALVGEVRIEGEHLWRTEVLSPALDEVSSLDLSNTSLSAGYAGFLVRSPYLSRLRELNLSNNELTPGDVYRLANSPLLQQLSRLDLRNNRLDGTPNDVRLLLGKADEAGLKWLDLSGNGLSDPLAEEVRQWQLRHCPAMAGPRPARLLNSLGMEFTLVPAGTFLMGAPESEPERYADELPQRPVTLTQSFYLGVYPVTQRQYEAIMGANPSDFHGGHNGGPDHPVDTVSWHDAVEFCRRLSDRASEREAGRVYRLPTEAEWEHACRAGTTSPYSFGDVCSGREANCDGHYPYNGAGKGPFLQRTTRVGTFEPNAWGLFDMHGNVWEWCADWYDRDSYRRGPTTDPTGPTDGEERVLRGGSWFFRAQRCRSAARLGVSPDGRYHIDGFRVALPVPV
jgi:uncharacterized protein (TIGR02996 family)